jgi:serine/threonine protein kinase
VIAGVVDVVARFQESLGGMLNDNQRIWLFKKQFDHIRGMLSQPSFQPTDPALRREVKASVAQMALLMGTYTRAQALQVEGFTINGTISTREAIIHVALDTEFKFICMKSLVDSDALQREFDISEKVHAQYACPSLIRYEGKRTIRGHLVLVAEFFPRSLQDFLMSTPQPFKDEAIIHIFFAVLAALVVLHKMGYVHCDVHPGNIMLSAKQSVKLIDLGSIGLWQTGYFTKHISRLYIA